MIGLNLFYFAHRHIVDQEDKCMHVDYIQALGALFPHFLFWHDDIPTMAYALWDATCACGIDLAVFIPRVCPFVGFSLRPWFRLS
jgi:hypothetical protein